MRFCKVCGVMFTWKGSRDWGTPGHHWGICIVHRNEFWKKYHTPIAIKWFMDNRELCYRRAREQYRAKHEQKYRLRPEGDLEIVRLWKQGAKVGSLARLFGKTRHQIYWILETRDAEEVKRWRALREREKEEKRARIAKGSRWPWPWKHLER